jgi:hypothetical protein
MEKSRGLFVIMREAMLKTKKYCGNHDVMPFRSLYRLATAKMMIIILFPVLLMMLGSCTDTKVPPTPINPSISPMLTAPPVVNYSPTTEVAITETQENRPPVLETIGDREVFQGSLLEFTIRATDPDDDNLTFAVSNLPSTATFNKSTQVFSFLAGSVGTFSDVTFSVTDGQAIGLQAISITVSTYLPVLLIEPPEGVVPLAIIYYGKATPTVSSTILNVRPQYFISNPAHGLWGHISGHGQAVFQDLSAFKAAGIKIIGYITAGYEGKHSAGNVDKKWYTLEMNRKLIQDMAEIDHVDGVFIDECTNFPDEKDKAYLQELTTFAHSYGLITWGNVGTNNFDPWFFTDGGFDLVHSTENWRGQNLNKLQFDWSHRISVTGFNPKYTSQDAFNMTVNAQQQGLAYCYITDDRVGYNSLPSWLEKYVDLLKQYKLTPEIYQPPPETGNTTGIVSSTPVPSGAYEEYNFTLKIVSTTVDGLSPGQELWCVSTTSDFPNLLTVGATLTGNMNHSIGWWVLKNAN